MTDRYRPLLGTLLPDVRESERVVREGQFHHVPTRCCEALSIGTEHLSAIPPRTSLPSRRPTGSRFLAAHGDGDDDELVDGLAGYVSRADA